MTKRVTVVLQTDVDKKLRLLQAKMMSDNASSKNTADTKSISYSFVINMILRKGLK